ncbi:MAG: metallophosphoesterase [Clostridia bacterium]|nr:metallophosphoesterase [Clostridia bacterium]MBR2296152.1 metallophosphoesterase [Clostridia bacterium]
MSIFTMADLHLPLSANKPMDIFGNRWQDYVNKIKKNWCAIVKDDDTVIIPGDISWAISIEDADADFAFIDSLPGRKLLGKGNHDYWWGTMSKNRAYIEQRGFKSINFLFNNAYEIEDFIVCGTRGWYIDEKMQDLKTDAEYDKIVAREASRLKMSLDEAIKLRADSEKEILVFLHFPPVYGAFVCEPIIDVLKEYNIKNCYYGHIHGVYNIPRSTIYKDIKFTLISADYLNFVPMKLTIEK